MNLCTNNRLNDDAYLLDVRKTLTMINQPTIFFLRYFTFFAQLFMHFSFGTIAMKEKIVEIINKQAVNW